MVRFLCKIKVKEPTFYSYYGRIVEEHNDTLVTILHTLSTPLSFWKPFTFHRGLKSDV